MLNGGAFIAAGINLFTRDDLGSQILTLNTVCSWLARKTNSAPHRQAQHHTRSRLGRSTIDILAAFISHLALFSVLTRGSNADIVLQAATLLIGFIPLAMALAALLMTHQTNIWTRLFFFSQEMLWLSASCFVAISDLSVRIMLSSPAWFGGLHPLQCWAVGMYHVAFPYLTLGQYYPRGDQSWPYAMIAAVWLGLVTSFVYLPPLLVLGEPRCIRLS